MSIWPAEALACVGKRFSLAWTHDFWEQNFIECLSTHARTRTVCVTSHRQMCRMTETQMLQSNHWFACSDELSNICAQDARFKEQQFFSPPTPKYKQIILFRKDTYSMTLRVRKRGIYTKRTELHTFGQPLLRAFHCFILFDKKSGIITSKQSLSFFLHLHQATIRPVPA